MQDSTTRSFSLDRSCTWATRISLLVLVAAAPWPFGSVTPRPAAALSAALVAVAFALFAISFRSRSFHRTPAWLWLAAALAFVVAQQVPLPAQWTRLLAPAVAAIYAPLRDDFGGSGWHALSIEPFRTYFGLLQLIGFAAAFWIASQVFRHSRERRVAAYTFAAVGVALALFAVYQKARFGTVLYGRYPVPSGTPYGPFVNHNHFAGFVEACGLVSLGLALGTAGRSASLAVLLGGASSIMGISILLSHSRGGLLATGAGLLVLTALSGRRDKRGHRFTFMAAGAAGIILFLVIFAPAGLFDRFSTLSDPAADRSVTFRVTLWSDSIDLAAHSPFFGTGLGTYPAIIPSFRTGPDETRAEFAESDWLQLLCETGILGVMLALGFLCSIGRRTLQNLTHENSPRNRGLSLGVLAAVAALVVHGLYDFNLHIPSNALLFAVLLGILARGEPAPSTASEPSRWFPLGIALAACLTLVFAVVTVNVGESRHLTRTIDPLLTERGEFSDVIQDLARSRKRVPGNPETAFLLGRLYNEEAYRARDAARYREIRLGQAVEAFHDALRRAPARGRYWFELAWSEANRGNDAAADPIFAHALELEPHLSGLRANYALFLTSRDRVDEALEQLERARELEPGLSPLEALNVIAPYVGHDPVRMKRAVGSGPEAEAALADYRDSP